MSAIVLQSNAMGAGSMIIWLVAMIAIMYFLMIRPQKNEQKRLQAMLNDLAVGDSVVTTSGFYGVVLDITDDDVIVEFGNNKNCRIPMRKNAIAEVEKADAAYTEPEVTEKRSLFGKKKDSEQ
ncbi:MAG: preprotein translocase subunit YajC [Lachnospiraceae bacterium]|nr:preprotein translocase subunit YajC [Lachnospiraceae bacterium]